MLKTLKVLKEQGTEGAQGAEGTQDAQESQSPLPVPLQQALALQVKKNASIPEGPSLWLIPPALGRIPFKATWMFRRSIVDLQNS